MRIKFIPAILAAAALAAAPAAAAPKPAPAVPAAAATEVAPGSEEADGDQLRRRGFLLPLAIIVAIVLGVILFTRDGDETPDSP